MTPENDEQLLRLLHSVLLEVHDLHKHFLTTDQRERGENVMSELWTCILYQRINTKYAPRTPRNRLTSFPLFWQVVSIQIDIQSTFTWGNSEM